VPWRCTGHCSAPLLPRWDLLVWEDGLRDIGRALIPCNWLQIMENSVDPTHVEWLHGRHLAWSRERAGLAAPTHYRRHQIKIGFERFRWGIIKRRVFEGGSEQDEFITDFVDGGDIMAWVTQGPIADRTRDQLVASDAGIALYRRMLLDELGRAEAGEDPLGSVRDPVENAIIELPQERNKLGGGGAFLAEAVAMSHVRHSPIINEIAALLEAE
jgi:hypothetical protein